MNIEYLNQRGDFQLMDADQNTGLYFPIANPEGIKAAITPSLHGDNKMGQNTFYWNQ